METFIDISFNADGEKASKIFSILNDMGLKYHIGEHDFSYDWKRVASIEEELDFIDSIQDRLKGTGAILRITSKR